MTGGMRFSAAPFRIATEKGILRDDFLNLGTDWCSAINTHGCVKLIQLAAQGRPVFQRSTRSLDLFARCGNNLFVLIEEILFEFFPFAQTCEPDHYIVFGFAR